MSELPAGLPPARRLESVSETARWALDAASVTLNYWESGDLIRSIVNVGDLGHGELRWPPAETYALSAFPHTEAMFAGACDDVLHVTYVGDCTGEQAEMELLQSLGKAGCLKVPILVRGTVWGEMWASRRLDQPRFDGEDVRQALVVAQVVASALEHR
jgi:GAF domain-containing protein